MRHQFDRYDSPAWFLTHALNYLDLQGVVGEPCKGSGNLSNLFPLIQGIDNYWTNDIDLSVESHYNLDAVSPKNWQQFPKSDWIITNPPFKQAFPVLKNAHDNAKIGVLFFLRLSFLEPTKEKESWLYRNPPSLVLVLPRFKFKKGKTGRWQTDTLPIAAMAWIKGKGVSDSKVVTIPSFTIDGFHDKPTNAPAFSEVSKIIKKIERSK